MMKSIWASVENPSAFRKINGWMTVFWFLAAFPICIFLSKSVPFLVFISVYAVVTGHLATWQAARVEVKQEEQEGEQDKELHAKVDVIHDNIAE
jgi:hypothetical protein